MIVVRPSEQVHRTRCSARIWQLTKAGVGCFRKGSPTLEFCLDPQRAEAAPTFVVKVWDHAIPHQIGKNLRWLLISSEQEGTNRKIKSQLDVRVN